MSQCLNPACLIQNAANDQFCIQCGTKLLLANRYRAGKILGQGGFGRTFKAIDQHRPSQPICVIKQFLPQGEGAAFLQKAGELFAHETRQLEALGSHDQIPTLYAYFSADNRQYLVQEFIEGQTLKQELDSEGVFTEQKIRQLLTNALPILQFIHSKKVIHRDIKPDNVIRRPSGQLVIVDFGAAKQMINTRLTAVGTVIGSAEFAAPEQSQGKPQYGSDLYSLGVTCLYLLTQISPFDLYDPLEDHWVWRDYLVNNPVSLELGKILEKLIARVFRQRYQSAQEVLADLNPTAIWYQTTSPPLLAKPPQHTPHLASPQFQNYQEALPGDVALEMIAIPAGRFLMGSANGEGDARERPQHPVTVPAFYLGKYAITNAQWKAVMGTEPASQLGEKFCGENQPVIYVSWDEAQGFCQKVSQKSGRSYRLPSEAEWEYACRAGSQTAYSFGDDAQQLDQYAWWHGGVFRGNFQTQPVGRKQPNRFGLYDMHGNVWEWCLDHWHTNYQGAPLNASAWISGRMPITASCAAVRGASIRSTPALPIATGAGGAIGLTASVFALFVRFHSFASRWVYSVTLYSLPLFLSLALSSSKNFGCFTTNGKSRTRTHSQSPRVVRHWESGQELIAIK